jgi:nucleoside-triphosphatase THEP1
MNTSLFAIIVTFCAIIFMTYSSFTSSIGLVYDYMVTLFKQNAYLGMMVASQVYYVIVPQLMNLFNFVTNSTFITWFSVGTDHDVATWTLHYLSKKYNCQQLYSLTCSIETSTSIRQIWYDKTKSDILAQIRYIPGTSFSMFWHKKKIIFANIASKDSLTMYALCYPWARSIVWKELFDEIREEYRSDINKNQQLYKLDVQNSMSQGMSQGMMPQLTKKIKIDDGSYVLTKEMKEIVDSVRTFLLPETKKMYEDNMLTYCHRIFAYGPPGTGKTHLATRIAGEFDLPLYQLNCENLSDTMLEQLTDTVQRGIIVVDEIDKCIYELVNAKLQTNKTADTNNPMPRNNLPSLSGWHRILDKIIGTQVIVYFTTNNYDLIKSLNHGSFVRPERIDVFKFVGNVTIQFINELFAKHYRIQKQYLTTEDMYIDKKTGLTMLTPADIISSIKMSNGNIGLAIDKIIEINKVVSDPVKLLTDVNVNRSAKKI